MPQIIKHRDIINDDWVVVRAAEDGSLPAPHELPAGPVLLPFEYWLTHAASLAATRSAHDLGVWLKPDTEPADLVEHFAAFGVIAIDFPVFRDGRGYSIARLLRDRYQWRGELRAIGDVLRDQLFYMERCGFDAYAVRADKDLNNALLAFGELTVRYQAAQDEPNPLFRRRHAGAVPV
jgi:uncharacterized protein (DUF934 family)